MHYSETSTLGSAQNTAPGPTALDTSALASSMKMGSGYFSSAPPTLSSSSSHIPDPNIGTSCTSSYPVDLCWTMCSSCKLTTPITLWSAARSIFAQDQFATHSPWAAPHWHDQDLNARGAKARWYFTRDAMYKAAIDTFGKRAKKNNVWFEARIEEMEPAIAAVLLD